MFKERVHWEMEIESFLFHIAGVWDSLLAKINNIWELSLKGRDVNRDDIEFFLNYLNERALLINLANFSKNTQELREWRNWVTHENLMYIRIKLNTHGELEVYFLMTQKRNW